MCAGEIGALAERSGIAPASRVDLCCGVAGPGRSPRKRWARRRGRRPEPSACVINRAGPATPQHRSSTETAGAMPTALPVLRISPRRVKLSCSTYSARGECRLAGRRRGLDEWCAVVLFQREPDHRIHSSSLQMFERGGRLRAVRGPATGLVAQALLLAIIDGDVRVGTGAVVGAVCAITLDAALARGLLRNPFERLGPAGWVTLGRATLVIGVAALTADSFERDVPAAMLGGRSRPWPWCSTTSTDGSRGGPPRRRRWRARLDGEVDAFLILVL